MTDEPPSTLLERIRQRLFRSEYGNRDNGFLAVLAFVGLVIYFYSAASSWGQIDPTVSLGPSFVPKAAGVTIVIGALWSFIAERRGGVATWKPEIPLLGIPVAGLLGACYLFGFRRLGFATTTLAILITGCYLFGIRRWRLIAGIGLVGSAGIYGFFVVVLGIYLPNSPLP